MHHKPPPPAKRPDPGLRDDPFVERLFGAMCESLFVLPGETFVDQARRWIDALYFTALLKPRDQREWLCAADVTLKQYAAVYSLVMQKRKGITAAQRQKHSRDYIDRAKAMQDARRHYDLIWAPRQS